MIHETDIIPDRGQLGPFVASCACGWRGSSSTRDAAVRLVGAHLRAIPAGDINPLVPSQGQQPESGPPEDEQRDPECRACGGEGTIEETYGRLGEFSRRIPCLDCQDDRDDPPGDPPEPTSDRHSPFPESRR